MQDTSSHQIRGHLSSAPASPDDVRRAWLAVLVSLTIFLAAAWVARTPLAQFPVFIPIYVTMLVIFDLITAVLLFGQYRALRSPALLVLACGYFFTASATIAYALIFPGLFAPTGLLGSGPQTSSAMYMFWHTGFPLAVIVYVTIDGERPRISPHREGSRAVAVGSIPIAVAVVALAVAAFTAMATAGQGFLPVFLEVNRTTPTGKVFLVGIWLLALLALVGLCCKKRRTALDVWLQVVMCVWLLDIALSAVINTGRYDLGWYVGRIYGLVAAGFLLIVLLSENVLHYHRLVQSDADLRAANDSLLQISMQDSLTGIANRRAFDRRLAEQVAVAIRHKRPLALALIDVDHFKKYNDAYGHQAGDECLILIANVLSSRCLRPTDLAARYGGEEFAMILPETDRGGAEHVVESVRMAVAGRSIPDSNRSDGRTVSVSIGVAVLTPDRAATPDQLVAMADAALYQAKITGRNRWVLTETTPPEDSPGSGQAAGAVA